MLLRDEPARRPATWLWLSIIAITVVALVIWAFVLLGNPNGIVSSTATAAAETAPATPAAASAADAKPDQTGGAPEATKAGNNRSARRAATPATGAPAAAAAPPPIETPKPQVQESPASEPATAPTSPPASSTTYDAASVGVAPPVLLTPTVNPLARKDSRYEPGSPAIEVVVNADGSVQSVKAATKPVTIGQTLEMVNGLSITKSWRFDPAVRDGQPVKYRLLVPLSALAARRAVR